MRVAFIHHSHYFFRKDGGVYSVYRTLPYRIWERYLAHFDEVVVLARLKEAGDADLVPESLASGPRVSFDWLPAMNRPWTYFRERRAFRRLVRQVVAGVDAVIIRTCPDSFVEEECERQGKPWAVEVVGDAWDAYWHYGSLLGKIVAPLAYCRQRRRVAKAPFVLYVGKTLCKRYPTQGKSVVVSNVELPPLEMAVPVPRKQATSEAFHCGLIGNFHNHFKGLKHAFAALRLMNQQAPRVYLHVLGQGNHAYWAGVAAKLGVTEWVLWDGVLPSGLPVLHWLDKMDFYIQPSFQEGLPRALVEAMSRGLPALGSTAGGIPELLPPECLHKPGNAKTLAAQMRRMVEDEAWRVRCSRRNLKTAADYTTDILNARRNHFWSSFADFVRESGGTA